MKKILRSTNKRFRILGLGLALLLIGAAVVVSQKPVKAATAADASSSNPCVAAPAPSGGYKHVIVIMFENHTYNQVIGSADAPYITNLASKCATSKTWNDSNYKVNGSKDGSYNSKPSYATLTNGVSPTVHGMKDDTYSTKSNVDNIYNQLRLKGKSGKDYFSWSGTGCSATGSGDYHDAIRYYNNIDKAYCDAHDVNVSQFMSDVNSGNLPEYSMVLPTNCQNMHSCSSVSNVVKNGDDWIKNFLPQFLDSPRYKSGDTAIFYLWDEDSPIPNILLSPSVHPGCSIPSANCNISGNTANPIGHFAALRTALEMLNLPLIGDTAQAPSLLPVFSGGGTTPPPPSDTTPPSVAISSPATGSSTSASSVTVNANASDNVAVKQVEFFVNGVSKAVDTSAPYSFNWSTTGLSSGTYTVKAVASDTASPANTDSDSITINYSAPSTCPVTLPTTDTGTATMTVNIPSTATYTAWSRILAPDTSNNSFFLQVDNGCPIVMGDSAISANTWTWVNYTNGNTTSKSSMNLSAGNHSVKMIGREANVGVDRVMFVTDTCTPTGTGDNCLTSSAAPPTVTLTSPTNSQVLSNTVNLTANASAGSGASIANVEFFNGTTSLGKDTSSPYSVSWDTTKVADGLYSISAVATDSLGQKSTPSAVNVGVSNADNVAPSQPGNFRNLFIGTDKVTGNMKVSLAWDASTDNKAVVGYHIYRNGNATPYATVGNVLTWDDLSVTPNTGYIYQVEAFDAAGNKSTKAGLGVTTPNDSDTTKPSTPTGLTGSVTVSNDVALNWNASTDDTGVTGYLIVRNGVVIDTTASTSYTDTSALPNTSYNYNVEARDGAGNLSANSNTVTVKTNAVTDTEKPTVPGNVTAVAPSSARVDISWSASTDNVRVAGYKVYRSDKANSPLVLGANTFSLSDTLVTPGTTYTYQVSSYDSSGNESTKSSPVNVTVPGSTTTPSFSDDFSNGAALWAPVKGTWSVVNGAYHQDAGGDAWSTAGTANWSDYSVEADVTPQSFITGTASSQFAALYGRWQDDTHWYYVVLRSNGNIELKRNLGNVYTVLASKSTTVTPGTTYKVKLDMQGSNLKVSLNGTQVLSATDSSIQSGKVGLGTYYAKANFDNVKVTQANTAVLSGFNPSADAYVSKDSPTSNYGTASSLNADGSPVQSSLLRFNVSGIGTRTVTKAVLNLYVTNSSYFGGSLFSVPSSWNEATVNWNTAPQPAAGAVPIAKMADVHSGKWVSVDVSSLIRGDGTYTIRINSDNSDVAMYSSRESSAKGASSTQPTLWVASQNLSL